MYFIDLSLIFKLAIDLGFLSKSPFNHTRIFFFFFLRFVLIRISTVKKTFFMKSKITTFTSLAIVLLVGFACSKDVIVTPKEINGAAYSESENDPPFLEDVLSIAEDLIEENDPTKVLNWITSVSDEFMQSGKVDLFQNEFDFMGELHNQYLPVVISRGQSEPIFGSSFSVDQAETFTSNSKISFGIGAAAEELFINEGYVNHPGVLLNASIQVQSAFDVLSSDSYQTLFTQLAIDSVVSFRQAQYLTTYLNIGEVFSNQPELFMVYHSLFELGVSRDYELSDGEKNGLLRALAISGHSYEFWIGENKDYEVPLIDFFDDEGNPEPAAARRRWWKVVLADLVGGVIGHHSANQTYPNWSNGRKIGAGVSVGIGASFSWK